MSPTGKFTLRLVIYGAFLLYLVGDLFIWHGFLAGRMDAYLKPLPGPPGDNSARIAEVYGGTRHRQPAFPKNYGTENAAPASRAGYGRRDQTYS